MNKQRRKSIDEISQKLQELRDELDGLRDQDGKEIYEGDIVSFPEYYETPEMTNTNYVNAKVIFIHGAFHIQQQNEEIAPDTDNLAHEMQRYGHRFIVIGNIYQNPELINNNQVTN